MADEITLNTSLGVRKGSLTLSRSLRKQITMAGTHFAAAVQTIGFAAHEALVIPADVATLGVAMFVNNDATNYVDVGRDVAAAFYPVYRFKAGEGYPVRLVPGVTYYAKADTAAVNLEFHVLED